MSKDFDELMTYFGENECKLWVAKAMLLPYLTELKDYYENTLLPESEDTRSGFETYGYTDEEHILERLNYISDKWKSAFRVRWLINLLESSY